MRGKDLTAYDSCSRLSPTGVGGRSREISHGQSTIRSWRGGTGSAENAIGNEIDLTVNYALNAAWKLQFVAGYFMPGAYRKAISGDAAAMLGYVQIFTKF